MSVTSYQQAVKNLSTLSEWEQMLDIASLRFIEGNENIVFLGPSGVGKTHLVTSIGIAAAKKRTSTYFIKCHDLIQNLKHAML